MGSLKVVGRFTCSILAKVQILLEYAHQVEEEIEIVKAFLKFLLLLGYVHRMSNTTSPVKGKISKKNLKNL